MFDFRYHALSLVAVFLALAVGLLLGVAIGDKELVSSARQDVRDSLRGDVRAARKEAADLRGEVARRERVQEATYPLLVADRLPGLRIGVVAIGEAPDDLIRSVRAALEGTGSRLDTVAVVRAPLNLAALADRLDGTRFASLEQERGLIERLGRRVGIQFTQGGRLLPRLRRALLADSTQSLGGLEGVVLVRPGRKLEGDEAQAVELFEKGLVDGLTRNEVPVVGVEKTDADPSQIPWFSDRDLASVDSVDQLAGRAALVFALAGASGAYGTKSTADALLPRAGS